MRKMVVSMADGLVEAAADHQGLRVMAVVVVVAVVVLLPLMLPLLLARLLLILALLVLVVTLEVDKRRMVASATGR